MMTPLYFLLADTGEALTLRLPMPENPFHAALAAIEALWPVVQPMSVDLTTMNPDGTVTNAMIGEAILPAPLAEDIPATVVSTITQPILTDWMRETSGQFLMLEVYRARAWLDSAWENVDHFTIQDGVRTLQIPIEKRQDGLWVSGPRPGLLLNAPIHYLVENEDGWLRARIWISWSVLWTASGTPGQQALECVLRTMVAQGWQPQAVPSGFDLG
jgi:hypothetical protein